MPSPQTVSDSITVRYGGTGVRYGRYRYGQRRPGLGTAGQQPVGIRVRTATQTTQTQADR